ncbi:hypothetical protein Salat_1914700 [Sesamum alatum]|uniref:Uncharacterized protein n=1 Tax=Sesamum alatum TaxID=300844 RepID=A0AAE2CIL0_9LAMI|nr:hypothetical protein Salat_1914700 [Sesamum alatum]
MSGTFPTTSYIVDRFSASSRGSVGFEVALILANCTVVIANVPNSGRSFGGGYRTILGLSIMYCFVQIDRGVSFDRHLTGSSVFTKDLAPSREKRSGLISHGLRIWFNLKGK